MRFVGLKRLGSSLHSRLVLLLYIYFFAIWNSLRGARSYLDSIPELSLCSDYFSDSDSYSESFEFLPRFRSSIP